MLLIFSLVFELNNSLLLLNIIIKTTMSSEQQMQIKQTFLRQEILEKGYDAQQFIEYLNKKLQIGDDLQLCSVSQLQEVVHQFVFKLKSQDVAKEESVDFCQEEGEKDLVGKSIFIPKPKNIFIEKYNFMEQQYQKSFQCTKIQDKFTKYKNIKCEVFDPERKSTGGFFGIGATSFLEFQVKTCELNWIVGRRYSDFTWLRNTLLKVYPTNIVPPIPEKKASKKTQRHVEKRMKILQYFLNDLIKIPEMMNNKYVEGFLRITDNAKFQQLKSQSEKIKLFESIKSIENFEGNVTVKFNDQNKSYLNQMTKFIPEVQKIYKQITRLGKAQQDLYTQQTNNLYDIGNLFAVLHEKSREILNIVPKAQGLKKINDVFISLNNLSIQWGNILRNQHQFIETNWNTFFKYIRNQLHGYTQLFENHSKVQEEFARMKMALDKKKEKTYNFFDPSKWEITKEISQTLTKEIIHDKAEAFRIMFPKDNIQIEKLRAKNFLYISQIWQNGNTNFQRSFEKYCENFKEFAIKNKVNSQQLSQLWLEMGANFSGTNNKPHALKEKPVIVNSGDDIMDD